MALETYRRKRDFAKTTEPAGEGGPPADGGLRYVFHKHAASRLHYDLRLELDGVLMSWAIPKGPSLDPRDKHLAVRVEDHPLEYGGFEGVIPPGEYGGGAVEIWDRGTWEPAHDPHEALAKGDLKFALHGVKLRGTWVLAKMKRRSAEEGKEDWLLIKHRDAHSVDGDGGAVLREHPESVASGRTVEQIAGSASSVWHSDQPADSQPDVRSAEETALDPAKLPGAKKARLGRFVEPELATLVKAPPDGESWLHEIKFDGYRAVARIEHGTVAMYSRSAKDWTARFRSLADVLARLPVRDAMLDGEVVIQLPDGTTSFQALQNDLGAGRQDRLLYYVFDLPHLDGHDLTGVPLEQRKRMLRLLLAQLPPDSRVVYTEDAEGNGPRFFEQGCAFGLEGIVSKRADSTYRPGFRGADWLKAKCLQRQEFVIGGFTDPSRTRVGFGALVLGVHEDGGLRYAGKVGTGFSDKLLRDLGERLRGMEVPDSAFTANAQRAPRHAHWVRPDLVCEVAFSEWTRDGGLRQPAFLGLREDKPASAVVEERPETTGTEAANTPPGPGPRVLGIALTHPDRVFWPDEGVTKRELAEYYARMAELMLPYVAHRPLAMLRCPDGIEHGLAAPRADSPMPCFFHKHAGADFRGPFERLTIVESEGPHAYIALTEPASLVALAQMGVLEIHVWGSRSSDIEHPDMMVFDLDPDPHVGWPGLVEAARVIRALLQGLGLAAFVKTTGGKGLHVVVPLEPSEDWAGVGRFARAVAEGVASVAPDRYTSQASKAKRAGRTFIDYLRNARGATSVAPFSTRARERATVSVPLRWEELGGHMRPDAFTLRNFGRRLAHLKGDPWEGYLDVRQTITPRMKRELGVRTER